MNVLFAVDYNYEEDIDEESGDTVTGYNVPMLTVLFGVM